MKNNILKINSLAYSEQESILLESNILKYNASLKYLKDNVINKEGIMIFDINYYKK